MGLSILTLGALLVGLIWGMGQVIAYLQPVLVPLAVAGIIAYLLDPAVSWLQKKGLSRVTAVVSVFITAILLISLLIILAIGAFKQLSALGEQWEEIQKVTTSKIETLSQHPWLEKIWQLESSQENVESSEAPSSPLSEAVPESNEQSPFLIELVEKHGKELGTKFLHFITRGTTKVFGLIGFALGFIMVPIYLYYLLKESSGIRDKWHQYVPLKSSQFKDEVVDTIQEINSYLISFFRGQVVVAFIDGALVGITLTLIGMTQTGLLIGAFLAILGIIPFIGNIICLIPACLLAYVHFSQKATGTLKTAIGTIGEKVEIILPNGKIETGILNQLDGKEAEILTNAWGFNPELWVYPLVVAGIFIVVQQINGLVTAPKIVGDSVGLHPMTVIFSMLFWSLILGGFLGTLLAVPLTAAVKVLFIRYVWDKKIMDSQAKISTS